MSVMHGAERRLDTEGVKERMHIFDLGRADNLAVISGKARDTIDVFKPVDLFIGGGQAQAAAAMPRDGLAGELFKLWIKLRAIDMHFRHVE